jgi:hypothetical protein
MTTYLRWDLRSPLTKILTFLLFSHLFLSVGLFGALWRSTALDFVYHVSAGLFDTSCVGLRVRVNGYG